MSPRFLIPLIAGVALAGSLHAEDGKRRGVVELFTSQGCSSCPPADAAFRKLVNQGDVIALAYHIDYWNYLGWADTLSSKENTERQYGYARTMGRSNVYTPQVIVNGRGHLAGADLNGINSRIDSYSSEGNGLTVPISAAMRGDELEINIGAGQGKANVVMVYFDKEKTINVEKGENSGKKISYLHSVTNVETVGMWDGKATSLTLPASVLQRPQLEGCAILLQTATADGDPAAILGATVVMAGKNI
ncbi:thioredoxin family protein [Rhizobium bangladeshense]|uniref:Thioredoxin family protein n=1 Tax=Rhizobium bangladeshense TaxID=1138189 RepID=A0ABS7LRB8_9HYPH|nr:thioredoxin family protein [Rhizobium bangladeshense]MBX4869015.1 thioredoxin family protein [Rhizobium bangladeshense]MBX4873147.1 thioredoxin family protein [Rhizobium bangladeshense]MBX4884525.1 thioredoxin family protein [Rhizobium bangladeshense]MBX4890530.1 thioredoxin family protein [Rhizobium bangladeshense]MBX4921294.1 thioredoxin family protein [Rhizobium bangladeshense]